MNTKHLAIRLIFSFIFVSAFGIGMWYNGASIPMAVLGALVMWCIGVGTGGAILIARRR
ncbi:MAG: hypothetical protein NTV29_09655 [Planctomycetota bacterium]|jgi:hypothetical protein|nr:hypothetical protein [Planctomycetota bacterium]